MGNSKISRATREQTPDYCNILVIGDTKSGKTSLITRFIADEFEPDSGERDILRMSFDLQPEARKIRLDLTEEDTNHTAELSAKVLTSRACMLVYSVTSQESFEKIESTFNHLKTHRDNPIVILVATKIDSETRVVSTAQGAELAKQHGWNFLETSAKENIHVTEAFHQAVRLCPPYKASRSLKV